MWFHQGNVNQIFVPFSIENDLCKILLNSITYVLSHANEKQTQKPQSTLSMKNYQTVELLL